MCQVMLSCRSCHTVKSILHENPRKVVWLFSLSYMKVHGRRQLQTTADDTDSGLRRQWMTRTAAADEDGGRRETAIKPYKCHIL